MDISRRKALLSAGSLGVSLFAGCASLPFTSQRLTLKLYNFDSEQHELDVEMLRAEGREHSESVVLRESYEMQPPNGQGRFEIVKSDVLESRKYVVRAELNDNRSVRARYLFYPDCTESDRVDEELYVEIHRDNATEEPYIRFQQSACGSDSWWY
ncbi:hypothetical protein [Haladaptatus sp. CMSO5]|uniref:hypothetical protein n=1 Tax=Haladaptatus sp. CMSO5 TaxID=3120514 RepID=UPI002FCDE993